MWAFGGGYKCSLGGRGCPPKNTQSDFQSYPKDTPGAYENPMKTYNYRQQSTASISPSRHQMRALGGGYKCSLGGRSCPPKNTQSDLQSHPKDTPLAFENPMKTYSYRQQSHYIYIPFPRSNVGIRRWVKVLIGVTRLPTKKHPK